MWVCVREGGREGGKLACFACHWEVVSILTSPCPPSPCLLAFPYFASPCLPLHYLHSPCSTFSCLVHAQRPTSEWWDWETPNDHGEHTRSKLDERWGEQGGRSWGEWVCECVWEREGGGRHHIDLELAIRDYITLCGYLWKIIWVEMLQVHRPWDHRSNGSILIMGNGIWMAPYFAET